MSQILVIEDDPNIARTLVELLGHHGFEASRAESGEAGLDRLAQERFDLVLLDVRLPGMNGFETCVRIRESHGASLPVIMLTAFGDPGSVRRGYEAGADDFLQKPPGHAVPHPQGPRVPAPEVAPRRDPAEPRGGPGAGPRPGPPPRDRPRLVAHRQARGVLPHGHAAPGRPSSAPRSARIALYDPLTETMAPALPVHGFPDEAARGLRFPVKPDSRSRWSFRTGRPYVTNDVRADTRLLPQVLERGDLDSIVLMPLLSEAHILGLLVACNKPGGFTEDDVQILSIFAGPAATFLRSRQIFERERRHSARLERLSALAGQMGAVTGRSRLLDLVVSRIQEDLGFERVAFYAPEEGGGFRLECAAGPERSADAPFDATPAPLRGCAAPPLCAPRPKGPVSELAVPVRAGDAALGVLDVLRRPAAPLRRGRDPSARPPWAASSPWPCSGRTSHAATERMARQMATLYDLGLETAALRDLRVLFANAAEEAGRLIQADHTSVFRLDERQGVLRLFASWNRDPGGGRSDEHGVPPGRGHHRPGGARPRGRCRQRAPPRAGSRVPARPPGCCACPSPTTTARASRPMPLRRPERHPEAGGAALHSRTTSSTSRVSPASSPSPWPTRSPFRPSASAPSSSSLVNSLLREIAGRLSPEQIFDVTVRRIHEAFPSYCGRHRPSRPRGRGLSGRGLREP